MHREAPFDAVSRREDGVPAAEGTLDEDDAEDDEDPSLVDNTPTLGNDVNSFGAEEDNNGPTCDLVLDEGASGVGMPPVESEE